MSVTISIQDDYFVELFGIVGVDNLIIVLASLRYTEAGITIIYFTYFTKLQNQFQL